MLLEEELLPDVLGDRPLEEEPVGVGKLADGGVDGELTAGLPRYTPASREPNVSTSAVAMTWTIASSVRLDCSWFASSMRPRSNSTSPCSALRFWCGTPSLPR